MSKVYIILVLLFSSILAKNQEFSQFYNVPQYYNSAFAGIQKCSNVVIMNKIHPILGNLNFYSNGIVADLYFSKIHGWIEADVAHNSTPSNVFFFTAFSVAYAYHNKFSKKIRFSMSIRAKFQQQNFNASNLIFADMISPYNNQITPNNENIMRELQKSLVFGGGAVLYGKSYYFSFFVNNFYSIYDAKKIYNNNYYVFLSEKQLIKSAKRKKIKINSAIFFNKIFLETTEGGIFEKNNIAGGLFLHQNFYENNFTFGVSPYMSLHYRNIIFAYSYRFFLFNLYNKKSSTHEISVKFRFKCEEKNKNNTIFCPAYKL